MQPTDDHKNVLKIKPPIEFTRASAGFFSAALDRVLADLQNGSGTLGPAHENFDA